MTIHYSTKWFPSNHRCSVFQVWHSIWGVLCSKPTRFFFWSPSVEAKGFTNRPCSGFRKSGENHLKEKNINQLKFTIRVYSAELHRFPVPSVRNCGFGILNWSLLAKAIRHARTRLPCFLIKVCLKTLKVSSWASWAKDGQSQIPQHITIWYTIYHLYLRKLAEATVVGTTTLFNSIINASLPCH